MESSTIGQRLVPSLLARDLAATLAFHRRLGFRISGAYPDRDRPTWIEVARDSVVLQFYAEPPKGTPTAREGNGRLSTPLPDEPELQNAQSTGGSQMSRVSMIGFLVLLLTGSANGWAQVPSDEAALVREGVALHDAGDFDRAIAKYRDALRRFPRSASAHYELANSLFAAGRYDECVEVARSGLANPGDVESALHTVYGSCFSTAGKPKKALAAFRRGLDRYPDDVGLLFNIAVTLFQSDQPERAMPHLERAIHLAPSYASAYWLLGQTYEKVVRRGESILVLMRFVSLEPNSSRASLAAERIVEQLFAGISTSPEADVSITLDRGRKANDFSDFMDVARSLAAAAMVDEEAGGGAATTVDALVSLVRMVAESDREDDLCPAVVCGQAAAPLADLDAEGALETFAWLVALRAGLDGAQAWLEANPARWSALARALQGSG